MDGKQRILSVRETEETRMVLILQLSHSWAGGFIPPPPTGELYSLNPSTGEGGSPPPIIYGQPKRY